MRHLTRFAAVTAALLAGAPRVLAQGCAMCYTEAAAQSPRAARQLDLAILTLLVPSVLMFGGVLVAAFRRRERDLAAEEQPLLCDRNPPQMSIPERRARFSPGVSASNSIEI
ncbi:MAG TPA: hypothetical protein VJW51_13375 [Candidatus Acidoferrales bacterium]|nr:hypothetical protein [Candidatus Acidoferrales bacterium]